MNQTVIVILHVALASLVLQTGCGTGQGPGSGPPPTDSRKMTLHVQNSCTNNVWVAFYDRTNGDAWPSSTGYWTINKGETLDETISCQHGDTVAFGAAINGDNSAGYWGVGYGGQLGCTACAYTCEDGDTTPFNLTCQ